MLRSLPAQLRELLAASDDPALTRLFPPAHADDARLNDEYKQLVGDDLLAERLSRLAAMEETIDAERVDEEQLLAWLGTLNDVRLVLGTRLDVTEEMYEREMPDDDPRSPTFGLFTYLGWLEEQIVDALARGIDEAPSGR